MQVSLRTIDCPIASVQFERGPYTSTASHAPPVPAEHKQDPCKRVFEFRLREFPKPMDSSGCARRFPPPASARIARSSPDSTRRRWREPRGPVRERLAFSEIRNSSPRYPGDITILSRNYFQKSQKGQINSVESFRCSMCGRLAIKRSFLAKRHGILSEPVKSASGV